MCAKEVMGLSGRGMFHRTGRLGHCPICKEV